MDITHTVKLSDLEKMPPEMREKVLRDLISGAKSPANGRIAELDARIAEFERRYELPSTDMTAEVESGTRKETDDIASWLMLLNIRKRVATDSTG